MFYLPDFRLIIAHCFFVAIAIFPAPSFAAAGDNCVADLTANVPETIDWRQVSKVTTTLGSTWRRGFINEPAGQVLISEDAEYMISGVAAPGTSAQIYIYAADYTEADTMKKPDLGTCFMAETADEDGFFRLKVNSEILWSGIGRDFVIDVFYRSPEEPEEVQENNMNYAVSTGILPKTVQIEADPRAIAMTEAFGAEADPAQREPYYYDAQSSGFTDADRNIDGDCKKLCDKLPLLRGVELLPWEIKPALLGANLDAANGLPVQIGRLMHTYYVGIPGRDSLRKADMESISQKALAMEMIKREFGIGPWVTESTILAFAQRGGGVKYIRDLLLGTGDRATLEEGLRQAAHIPETLSLSELFPANASTEILWAKDFLDLVSFWTGNLAMNTCLLLNDPEEKESFIDGFDNGVIDNLVSTEYACDFVETHGKTPRLLLYTEEGVSLQPDFQDAALTYADQSFAEETESFTVSAGKKLPLYYRYRFTTPFSKILPQESCLNNNSLPRFITSLESKYQLSATETAMVAQELHENFPDTDALVKIRITDPVDVSARLRWLGNDKELDLFRLFFKFETGVCVKETIDLPDIKRGAGLAGFESGII